MEPLTRKEWAALASALEDRITKLEGIIAEDNVSKATIQWVTRKIQDDRYTLQKITRHLMFAKE